MAIEIGSVVALKSGGQAMTALRVDADNAGSIVCCWFDMHSFYQEKSFPAVGLAPVPERPKTDSTPVKVDPSSKGGAK